MIALESDDEKAKNGLVFWFDAVFMVCTFWIFPAFDVNCRVL